MAFNGSGTFNRLYNWVDDRVNGINIRADKMDGEQAGFATGLTNCVTRDGQTTILANLKMSGKKHTGVAPASARNQYLDVAAAQDGKIHHAVTVNSDVDSVALTMYPTLTAYTTGLEVRWISSGANTGSANLQIDGLSLTRLVTGTSATLTEGAIASAAMQVAIYQGPGKWSLQTRSNNPNFNSITVVSTVSVGANLYVGGFLNTSLATVALGSTTDLSSANFLIATSTTAVTLLATAASGVQRIVQFGSACTMIHGASTIQLPGQANWEVAKGDMMGFAALGTTKGWLNTNYQRTDGRAMYGPDTVVGDLWTLTSANATTTATTSGAALNTGLKVTITPRTTAHQVYLSLSAVVQGTAVSKSIILQIRAGTSAIPGAVIRADSNAITTAAQGPLAIALNWVHSPQGVAAVTYNVYMYGEAAGTTTLFGSSHNNSTLTAMVV